MLSGYECHEDQTGWLAGGALWAAGAGAGCLLAMASTAPALAHWQVLGLAAVVSVVSLGLRLPVFLTRCAVPVWLLHAVWLLALFAQVNWAGFLALRAADGTVAAEALLIGLALEIWLVLQFGASAQLPWLRQMFGAKSNAAQRLDVEDNRGGEVRREFVDGIDEHGQRYLSGSVRVHFQADQRSEVFVLSFCPALVGTVELELELECESECESENVSCQVEHATETGARISVRRQNREAASWVSVAWFAQASASVPQHLPALP